MNIQISENLKAHFLRLYQMAICDDNFSKLELKMLYRFAEERGVTAKNLDEILLSPVDTKNTLPQTLEDKIEYLYDLVLMIWADDHVDDNERSALEKYIKLLGFVEENVSAIANYLLEAVKSGKTKSDILYELQN
ncbi:hypothetical protein CMT89_14125 [Elizabethkingia anophelis]|uniref:hypothetical protein n=1 Tax=Elizabethkingia anophelis TaxID=1117645 RepID=UPI0007517C31|nr:hypothetical protein [Elizabethkingia anophelis]AQW89821.1 hypothetical protein BBD28_03700 [Elizabethkingia anophelis]AVF46685.1 hypothetical protein AL491_00700 [Elizabethkingia anophelis]AVF50676.1 hypothetical protein AL492_03110 [Elizabethkingia anophelis]KUY13555.1 hypothetical protein ATB94_10575 [Elizabethkingia anophelis]MBG0504163.1 hypothetical protein [Elizabethkingia anophelis]